MKVVLAAYENISRSRKHGFGFLSYRLALALREADLLESLVCLDGDPDLDIPAESIHRFSKHWPSRVGQRIISVLSSFLPGFDHRLAKEILFDRFVTSQLGTNAENLLFCTRPLFARSVRAARQMGMKVWVQASIPHPLTNYSLVRNEELRLDLPRRGPYSDIKRAIRLAGVIAKADKLICPAEEIGRYAYRDYVKYVGVERILPLHKFFVSDASAFADIAAAKTSRDVDGEITFLHVSHMNLIKGIPYLLEAWRLFKQGGRGEGCRLLLVGAQDSNTDELIARDFSDLADVEATGYVRDIRPYMARGDVFISPSISDCGPGTIAEAMGAGMPVISSRNCGSASLIREDVSGYTYRFNDPEGLCEILRMIATNRPRVREMGRAARQAMSSVSMGDYADEIVAALQARQDRAPESRKIT